VRDATIVLVAGTVKVADRVGHHDYLAGCRLLAFLLGRTASVRAVVVGDGWPTDDHVLDGAAAIVFYTGGVTKHAFRESAERIARLQRALDDGVGLVAIHQAVRYPREFAGRAMSWLGGVHVPDAERGHWPTRHEDFPPHPVTRGVGPFAITDGWLNGIRFVEGGRGVTPLVWSSRRHGGSCDGGDAAIVSWTYDRPGGGRSFCFTGVDAHAAWSVAGVRQLIVNGILWSAHVDVPAEGASCAIDEHTANAYLTPRTAVRGWSFERLRRRLRRIAGRV
jgi:hypothetical protein